MEELKVFSLNDTSISKTYAHPSDNVFVLIKIISTISVDLAAVCSGAMAHILLKMFLATRLFSRCV